MTLAALPCCSGPPAVEGNPELRARTFDAMVAQMEDRSGVFVEGDARGDGPGRLRRGELAERHRNAAVAAEEFDEFYRSLHATAIELRDPHVVIEPPDSVASRLVVPWMTVVSLVGDHPWVVIGPVWDDRTDPRTHWCELLAVDGVPTRRAVCLDGLLAGVTGSPRTLRCRSAQGEEFECVAPCTAPADVLRPPPIRDALAETPALDLSTSDLVVASLSARRLGDRAEVAVLRIGSLDSDELGLGIDALSQRLEALCETARGAETIVIDLRRNGGGDVLPTLRLVSLFDPQREQDLPLRIARPVARKSEGEFETRGVLLDRFRAGDSLPPPIPGKLVVLVDDQTASGAEWTAALLRCRAGAVIVGTRTAGAEWVSYAKRLPDGSTLTVGIGGGVDEECGPFQGIGVAPDIDVPFPHEIAVEKGASAARIAFDDAILAAGLQEAGLEPAKWIVPPKPKVTGSDSTAKKAPLPNATDAP